MVYSCSFRPTSKPWRRGGVQTLALVFSMKIIMKSKDTEPDLGRGGGGYTTDGIAPIGSAPALIEK